jgi:hypothetical protein
MDWRCRKMARQIDLDQLMKYPLRRESALCDEEHADPHFLNGVESVLEWAQTLPTLTPTNEWVRVEERLPENGQIVLFHQKDGFIYCAEYFVGKELMSPEWFIDNDSWNAKVVTHWMPLPAPPEKENSHE